MEGVSRARFSPEKSSEIQRRKKVDNPTDIRGRALPKGEIKLVFDIEDARNVSVKERTEATELAINIFRQALGGIEDFAVMSSTAMYLSGLEKGIEEISKTIPGDFDGLVFSDQAMSQVVERLNNIFGVVFREFETKKPIFDGNPVRTMPDREAKVLSGTIPVVVGKQRKVIFYPFEIFQRTRIAPERLKRYVERRAGFPVLSLSEGLREQYRLNFRLEGKIDAAVRPAWDYLEGHREIINSSPELKKITLERLQLTNRELENFYSLLDDLREAKNPQSRAVLTKRLVNLLSGGFKTRAAKRHRSLGVIDEITKLTVGDKKKREV